MADLESFIPRGDEAPEADDAFTALEEATANEEVVIEEVAPPPFGRSLAFDFGIPGFALQKSHGPLETRGLDTLRGWVAKCLVSARGAHPIHPDGYGVEGPFDIIGSNVNDFEASDWEERINNALTFHPRITGITNFETEVSEADEAVFVSFQLLLDGEETMPIQGLRLA